MRAYRRNHAAGAAAWPEPPSVPNHSGVQLSPVRLAFRQADRQTLVLAWRSREKVTCGIPTMRNRPSAILSSTIHRHWLTLTSTIRCIAPVPDHSQIRDILAAQFEATIRPERTSLHNDEPHQHVPIATRMPCRHRKIREKSAKNFRLFVRQAGCSPQRGSKDLY